MIHFAKKFDRKEQENMTQPIVLCIMDGVGISQNSAHNAVKMAKMPFFNSLLQQYPHSRLDASGPAVGLPDGTMGNSEVGHITIGAGRVVNQFLRRFQLENWDKNAQLRGFIESVKSSGGIVHMAGLMSDGRVHSDIHDMMVIAKRIMDAGLRLCIHFIADGRDTYQRRVGAIFCGRTRVFRDFVRAVLCDGQKSKHGQDGIGVQRDCAGDV